MATVFFPNGETQHLEGAGLNGRVTLDQAQAVVGGYVDVIDLIGPKSLIIADDFTGCDYNEIASFVVFAFTCETIVICGAAICVDTQYEGWGCGSGEE